MHMRKGKKGKMMEVRKEEGREREMEREWKEREREEGSVLR